MSHRTSNSEFARAAQARFAFTRIELLVVIAIPALFVSREYVLNLAALGA